VGPHPRPHRRQRAREVRSLQRLIRTVFMRSRLREVSHKRTRIRSPYRRSRERRDAAARAVRDRAGHISGLRGTQHHRQNHRRYGTSGTIDDWALHAAVQCRCQGRSRRVWRQREDEQHQRQLPQRRAYDTRGLPGRLPAERRSASSDSTRRVGYLASHGCQATASSCVRLSPRPHGWPGSARCGANPSRRNRRGYPRPGPGRDSGDHRFGYGCDRAPT
jgi:hypothetical protein